MSQAQEFDKRGDEGEDDQESGTSSSSFEIDLIGPFFAVEDLVALLVGGSKSDSMI